MQIKHMLAISYDDRDLVGVLGNLELGILRDR